ncbi:hypothetical protein [Streptomyces sp. NPDC007083]|uniref:hypothetical protein n=1 Tax=Streptomyces sp. NPDC007083 TaxID=3156913 RepID=UPI0033C3A18F
MSRDFAEVLGSTASTDDLMDVDTSFLDAYRRGGSEGFRREQTREAGAELASHSEASTSDPDEPDVEVALAPEPDHEPEQGDAELIERGSGQCGGSSGAVSGVSGAPVEETATDAVLHAEGEPESIGDAALDEGSVTASTPSPDEFGELTSVSLRFTDHQDAVQSSTGSAKGGSGGDEDAPAALPRSGFRLSGVKSQPHIKALPDSIISVLREQLRAAAVRELAVPDATAREFSQRLSQGTLVTAFLIAQLDLRLNADPATARAAELFRSQDPLLSSVAARMARLEELEYTMSGGLRRLQDELAAVRATGAVIEQALAYSIADRTENFLRGSHNIHDAPITHKSALYIRDRAREATRKQAGIERDRDGRPIR